MEGSPSKITDQEIPKHIEALEQYISYNEISATEFEEAYLLVYCSDQEILESEISQRILAISSWIKGLLNNGLPANRIMEIKTKLIKQERINNDPNEKMLRNYLDTLNITEEERDLVVWFVLTQATGKLNITIYFGNGYRPVIFKIDTKKNIGDMTNIKVMQFIALVKNIISDLQEGAKLSFGYENI